MPLECCNPTENSIESKRSEKKRASLNFFSSQFIAADRLVRSQGKMYRPITASRRSHCICSYLFTCGDTQWENWKMGFFWI